MMLARRRAAIKRRWHELAPAGALMIVSTIGVCAATVWPMGDHDQYAVVAPPSYDLARTIGLVDAAGGEIVEVGGSPNVIIAHSADKHLVAALYRSGAWLVIDPLHVRGCLGFPQPSMFKERT
jgi:hypothetical protein